MLIYEKIEDGIFLVKSDIKAMWKCNGLLIKNVNGSGNILIDCNFSKREYKQLLKNLDNQITAYFATHTHLDHANNLHFLEELKPDLDIFCPIPENEYLLNIDNFVNVNGALDFGVGDIFKSFIFKFLKFKELKSVIGFKPGENFKFGKITIKTIPVLSHSPGHTVFLIENISRSILFTSDMGLEDFGPWYGFKYNNLKDLRNDVKKIEELYLNNNYILASSHGEVFFEKQPEIFKKIFNRVNENEAKLLNFFEKDPTIPKSLEDLTLKGFIYNPKVISKWKKLDFDAEKMLHFWEGYFILNHIEELLERQVIKKVEDGKWILNNNMKRSSICNGISS
ncbi:MAG: MBL fold metallo-hydrolase [Promethearchaeota archaeon]